MKIYVENRSKNVLDIFCYFTTAVIWAVFFAAPLWAGPQNTFTITDFEGRQVEIPARINRVVTISDGMIAGVMTCLGQAEKIVGIGSACLPKIWEYDIPSSTGTAHEYRQGMNPVFFLNPFLADLPVVSQFGSGINFEAIARLTPDLIIVRTGSCPLCASKDVQAKNLKLLASLGAPLVVLHGPNTFDRPDIGSITREIELLGAVFQKQARAKEIADFLLELVNDIKARTADIPPDKQKRVLMLGLSPTARENGGAGHVKGEKTVQTYLLNEFAHARNAYSGTGAWNILNAEQLIALDPDLIVLVTAWGYHPPEELYDAPYYKNLVHMRAVENRAITALPWTPCNCEKRLEYPIDVMVMARAAYPQRFTDIDFCDWLHQFYMTVYGVSRDTASRLVSCQWMGWACKGEKK
ncbi:ABC transporter substrate-binding protein [uncultured Desulfobacter sp.]|uniref:ABC transporter substrate-binding protein n=1 Tax=uncultured Desulfobacter sp. TaxID=240139 RepID=UPI002AAB00CB|nr:ABC transporter substrate-binding protein [uncultured Desulfobacter sp.]